MDYVLTSNTAIFVEEQEEKMKYKFERDQNRDFPNKYEQCKGKCPDPKFERFYTEFIGVPRDRGRQYHPRPH